MQDRLVSYAQNREDVILAGFFPEVKDGFYVDIGAQHPIEDSVTKYFYNLGWHGINVEPNSITYAELIADRPRDINVNVGIADKPGTLQLRVYDKGDGLSTFSEQMKKDYQEKGNNVTKLYHENSVKVTTLKDLFNTNHVDHINFMKIDIEGYEYNALVGNDWKQYRPEVLCIEANHILKDWRPLLQGHGYSKVFFDGLNEYYVARESKESADSFSYVQAILGKPIISLKWNHYIEELVRDNKILLAQQKTLKDLTVSLERQIELLNAHIYQQSRLRNIIKRLLRSTDAIILLHLNKLAKRPYYYPAFSISEHSADNPIDMLGIIHNADSRSFAGSPNLGWRIKRAVGSGLQYTYVRIRRILLRVLRACLRLIRKTRRGRAHEHIRNA